MIDWTDAIALVVSFGIGGLIAWRNHIDRTAEWDAFMARRAASLAKLHRRLGTQNPAN